jgi:hypothetical protein
MPGSTHSALDARPAAGSAPWRPQYSLISLLIAMTVMAIGCWIFLTLSGWFSYIALLIITVALIPAVVSALVYGQGAIRAFALGCIPPVTLIFFWLLFFERWWRMFRNPIGDFWEAKVMFAIALAAVVISGLISVLVRWVCLRWRPTTPPELSHPPVRAAASGIAVVVGQEQRAAMQQGEAVSVVVDGLTYVALRKDVFERVRELLQPPA